MRWIRRVGFLYGRFEALTQPSLGENWMPSGSRRVSGQHPRESMSWQSQIESQVMAIIRVIDPVDSYQCY